LVIGSLLGCSEVKQEQCDYKVNYDSLFGIGDSILSDHYTQEAIERMYQDSLKGEVSSYQIRLNQKQIKEQKERIIYKDTIIYRKTTKTITDTIYNKVYLTDTIRDTIYVTIKKNRKRGTKRN